MWAVLGLVSIDVLSVSVAGLEDGQHLGGSVAIRVRAADNGGQARRSASRSRSTT